MAETLRSVTNVVRLVGIVGNQSLKWSELIDTGTPSEARQN